jgi:hypothetical protein
MSSMILFRCVGRGKRLLSAFDPVMNALLSNWNQSIKCEGYGNILAEVPGVLRVGAEKVVR